MNQKFEPPYLNLYFDHKQIIDEIKRVVGESFKLRRLTSMTVEEALELCKMVAPVQFGDYRYSKWKVELDPKSTEYWMSYDVTNKNSDYTFTIDLIDGEVRLYDDGEISPSDIHHAYWFWYLRKGFAIPVTEDNKNLVEIGKATYI